MKIALDAFGGDDAPASTISGALLALKEWQGTGENGLEITLFGDLTSLDGKYRDSASRSLKFLDIPANGAALAALPEEEDIHSPIRVAIRMHNEGEFDAVVSAGPTGAQVLASLYELEKCSGITRPAIGSLLPTANGYCLLLDVGASLVASPHHLVQFAAMGHVYMKELQGIAEPRIGLVNVASEAHIGDRGVVEAHRLLDGSGFNFVGFVEGRDIPAGAADVVVTNGFLGNVLLKFMEGLPPLLSKLLPVDQYENLSQSISRHFDYHAIGGAPLLGVKGVSIICHGSSTPRGIASAILEAARVAQTRLHDKIEEFLIDRFSTYFSQVKYLRSFRRSLRPRGKNESMGE